MSLFVDINPETIVPELVTDFENRLGVVLKAGDQRREFLQGFGYFADYVWRIYGRIG